MTMSYIPLFVSKHKHLLKEKLPLLVLFIVLKIVFTNTQIPLRPPPPPHPNKLTNSEIGIFRHPNGVRFYVPSVIALSFSLSLRFS